MNKPHHKCTNKNITDHITVVAANSYRGSALAVDCLFFFEIISSPSKSTHLLKVGFAAEGMINFTVICV